MKVFAEGISNKIDEAIINEEISIIKAILTEYDLDVNSFIFSHGKYYSPLLMKALISWGVDVGKRSKPNVKAKIEVVEFLLEKGANPNLKRNHGDNCMHISANVDRYPAELLLLFLKHGGDINSAKDDGKSALEIFVEVYPTNNKKKKLKELAEEVFKSAGQNLLNVKKNLFKDKSDLIELLEKYGETTPNSDIQEIEEFSFPPDPSEIAMSVDLKNDLIYADLASQMWKQLVPESGQANTVQGELLRAIEKLRDESHRNGNANFDDNHRLLADFIFNTLKDSEHFNQIELKNMEKRMAEITRSNSPYLEDDHYNYLVDKVCIFYKNNPELIPHVKNPDIYR
ncbi:MAG: ankyrin repeat domain-containing protein [Bacteroidetes bacterium]|nr:MAG: ankyrin repeat domain-containing protein [Bacteroidota bacterium]